MGLQYDNCGGKDELLPPSMTPPTSLIPLKQSRDMLVLTADAAAVYDAWFREPHGEQPSDEEFLDGGFGRSILPATFGLRGELGFTYDDTDVLVKPRKRG